MQTKSNFPKPESVWYLRAGIDSLKGDSAILALRLGAAVNFIRASQRWYIASSNEPGPAGDRNRVCAFLVSGAYLKEVVDGLLKSKSDYQQVVRLAKEAGAEDELIQRIDRLRSKGPQSLYSTLLV